MSSTIDAQSKTLADVPAELGDHVLLVNGDLVAWSCSYSDLRGYRNRCHPGGRLATIVNAIRFEDLAHLTEALEP